MNQKQFEEFKQKKDEVTQSLATDIEKGLIDLGDDVKYLQWFVSAGKLNK